jgi:hypothetical protein
MSGRRKKEEGRKPFDEAHRVTRRKKEEGSSATDSVTDVTDVRKKEEGRKPFDEAHRVTRSPREGVIDRIGLGH